MPPAEAGGIALRIEGCSHPCHPPLDLTGVSAGCPPAANSGGPASECQTRSPTPSSGGSHHGLLVTPASFNAASVDFDDQAEGHSVFKVENKAAAVVPALAIDAPTDWRLLVLPPLRKFGQHGQCRVPAIICANSAHSDILNERVEMAGTVLQWDQLTSLIVRATLSCSRDCRITAERWGNAMRYQTLAEPFGVLVPILAMGAASGQSPRLVTDLGEHNEKVKEARVP
jgi:hypothetical protein